jgi:hypothetical protein
MRFRKYEIRMYVTKTLHDRVFQEAKNRGATMSQVARGKLSECFSPKNEITFTCDSNGKHQENQNNKITNSSLTQIEKQQSSTISKIESLRALTQDHSNYLLQWSINFILI